MARKDKKTNHNSTADNAMISEQELIARFQNHPCFETGAAEDREFLQQIGFPKGQKNKPK